MLSPIIRLVLPFPTVHTFCVSGDDLINSDFFSTVPPNSKVFLQAWFIDMWIGKRRS